MKKLPKQYWKEMCQHYHELSDTGIQELKFERMNVDYLLSVLDEVKTIGGELVGAVVENAVNRHQLDKVIHAKMIFKDEPKTL